MTGLLRERRGAVALMTGVISPMLLGFLALTVDSGFWVVSQTRLQVAADAGAMGASFLLTSSSFKAMTAANQQSTAQTVALAEAQGAMTKLTGTLSTPATVSVASDYSYVTVTLRSQAASYFGGVFKITAPVLTATATATYKSSVACVLALGTTGNAILVDNGGTLTATGCIVSKASIYLNSGTISAATLTAAGTISQSNSGSNKLTATNQTQNSTATMADPYASKTAPTAGTCSTDTTNYTAYGTYTVSPQTWCKSMTFGGNGSSITFNPGVYYINNTGSGGDLTFNNESITSAAGVTFVMTGTNPGNFSWTNNSSTTYAISAPSSGATAGIALWQVCNSGGSQTTSFQGGSTLNISGSVYAPCSAADVGNNAQIAPPLNASMNFISKSVYVHGSAALKASGSGTSGGSSIAVLTQ